MKSVSLFTGAGGLDLGLEAAGFQPALCIEIDRDARKTLAINRPSWRLSEPGDILVATPAEFLGQAGLGCGEADLLVAGPVCQPFSHAARWAVNGARGLADPRAQTLRACVDLIEFALPRAVLIENVYGMARGDHAGAIAYIRHRISEINAREGTKYLTCEFKINSAEYGVPQVRRRSFIALERDGRIMSAPEPTHGEGKIRFRSAWDAIGDLESESNDAELLAPTGQWAALLPSIPEGRNYLWHTNRGGGLELFGWRTRYWTFLLKLAKDRPSWTLTAQPGPATGPFHWKNRRLSVAEMCRIQTFPGDYQLHGSYQSQRRQIGNAVPCLVAEVIGRAISEQWFGAPPSPDVQHAQTRSGCPPPEPCLPVPRQYGGLAGPKDDHLGPGKGPGATRNRSGES